MTINRRIVLASRPAPHVSIDNFRLETGPLEPLGQGEVRVRNHFLSLDPYMRGRMSEAKSYAAPQPLDVVMQGGTVGAVVESRNDAWRVDDTVVGFGGWQEFSTSRGADLRKVQAGAVPLSAYLGSVGMPGVTAWYGLNKICRPKAGETLCVSAASGAVGSVVGHLAKKQGVRVVGIAGGAAKCAHVTETLGFDLCVDYKAPDFEQAFEAATPDGVDAYFENVGGTVGKTVISRLNAFGRVAVCGLISGYDGNQATAIDLRQVLVARLTIEGFIVTEHLEAWPEALEMLGKLVATGELHFRESVANGLEAAPAAFLGMLKGENLGKQLVKLI